MGEFLLSYLLQLFSFLLFTMNIYFTETKVKDVNQVPKKQCVRPVELEKLSGILFLNCPYQLPGAEYSILSHPTINLP